MKVVFDLLNSIFPVSSKLQQHLLTVLKSRILSKKQFLLKTGSVCNKVYFIEKGLIRCFYEKDDKEVCSWFMKEGDIIISVESFYNQMPSYENIQALEDCFVYYIEYDDLQFIYNNFPEFNYVEEFLLKNIILYVSNGYIQLECKQQPNVISF